MQLPTENKEVYLRALYSAANDCEFGILKKERIRDQFIAGILDEKLAEKLEHAYMSNRDQFNLEFAVEYTRTHCDIKEGRKQDKAKTDYCSEVSEFNSFDKSSKRVNQSCSYCGNTHAIGRSVNSLKRNPKDSQYQVLAIVTMRSRSTIVQTYFYFFLS